MATTLNPIYLVGGSKGGVGKSIVALAPADHLQQRDASLVLVETDTSNPDVMKAVHGEIECAAFNLEAADDWIGLVNYCDAKRDAVVSTAARNQAGVARYGATLAFTLDEPSRRLVVFWVINRTYYSIDRKSGGRFGELHDLWGAHGCGRWTVTRNPLSFFRMGRVKGPLRRAVAHP